MNESLICMFAGPVISLAVSALKRLSFVSRYPKTIAFVLSAVVAGATAATGDSTVGWGELVQCVLVPFAGAVATYEAVTRQVTKVDVS